MASAPWHHDFASPKQARFIERFGFEIGRELSKGEACYLIDQCLQYEAAHPPAATPKQRRYLAWQGAWRPGMSKAVASKLIGELKQREAVTA